MHIINNELVSKNSLKAFHREAGNLLFLLKKKKKTLWSLDGVHLPQGYKATTRRQLTIYHSIHLPGVPGTQLIELGRMKD